MTSPRSRGVVIDIQALQNPLHRDRGIGRYTIDHVDALLARGVPIAALCVNLNLAAEGIPEHWIDTGLVAGNTLELARRMRNEHTELVYHVASPYEPAAAADDVVVPHWLAVADCVSTTLFDLIPMQFPEWYQRTERERSFTRRRAELLRRADAVLAISEYVRVDAVTRLGLNPDRTIYQGTGLPTAFRNAASTSARVPSAITRPFVLTVPGWGEPRKNPASTFEAWARLPQALRDRYQLAVVCGVPAEGPKAWLKLRSELGLRPDDIVFTGRVSDVELRAMYRECALMVFGSVAEGFGLPVLEAAAGGAPVLSSNTTSLPEILNEPTALFPVNDAGALAHAIADVLTDPNRAAVLRAAGQRATQVHTWEAVAERTDRAWDGALAHEPIELRRIRRQRATMPPRLALLGPYPPAKSGIGRFNERLVEAIGSRAAIDVFSTGDDPMPPSPRERAHRQFPIEAFKRVFSGSSYDTVIHTIGNSHYHRKMLDAATTVPGILWLHEVQLAGLYITHAGMYVPGRELSPRARLSAKRAMLASVERVHGRPADGLTDDTWWRTDSYAPLGFPFLSELLKPARAIIVSSSEAAEALVGQVPDGVDVHILNLPYPDPPDATIAAGAPQSDDEPWIVTLGWVDPIKQPETLIAALATVRETVPARLAFVGESHPDLQADLERRARELGVADAITFSGFTDHAKYVAWSARASVIVQLRAYSMGEGSAAVTDALAAGRATITNIPTARHVPGDVMVSLDQTDPGTVARAITEVLSDPNRRKAYESRAAEYARSWSFADLAQRVLEIAASLPALPVP